MIIQDNFESQLEQKKEEYRTAEAKVKVPLLTYALIGISVLVVALLFLYSQLSSIMTLGGTALQGKNC